MMSSRFVVAGLIAALTATVGCAADKEDLSSYDSEIRLAGTRYLGKLQNGQTRTAYYYNQPLYRSYGFDAKGGDEVTIDVRSTYGDAVAWITDAKYRGLAFNDDASRETWDAKVQYKVPEGQPSRSYRIVFRDYDTLDATFAVTLAVKSAPATCTYEDQQYTEGDSFGASDGCNTCACDATGSVACTEMECGCNPATESHRTYLGTPDQCMVMRYSCPAGQILFSNDCGCGCETVAR